MADPTVSRAALMTRARLIGLTPFATADATLAAAVTRGGGLGALDISSDPQQALSQLALIRNQIDLPYAIRAGRSCRLQVRDVLTADAPWLQGVILAWDTPWQVHEIRAASPAFIFAEVTSLEEAIRAAAAGVDGLIARGHEAGGRVGDLTTFVLLQQLLAAPEVTLPIWACGGIGPRTAVAAYAGGAAGVVIDSQLSLLDESNVPRATRRVIERMDGSETTIVGDYRIYRSSRPGGSAPEHEISADQIGLLVGAELADGRVLPIGQDGHLAALFAHRFSSAEKAARSILHSLTPQALGAGPQAQGKPIRDTLGIDFAIAQGPMTRVSDQPGFAAAVAAEGAMPFIAVALATGPKTEALLNETKELLGDRPWGAGILGFVSEELREQQLAVIHQVRPKSVLIAGGKPAQAKALEAEGIPTYLHVPSPILFGQFLRSGVRRFVFEGAECGGHVGPRSSFSLWEEQLNVLASFLDEQPGSGSGKGIEIFFAGGIHDARSAAMVAAMAAPAAERGVGIGVLMGTAYLFTAEAVEHGAITDTFQQQAIAATATATVETAPGHQTRCLFGGYVDEFEAARERLEASDIPAQQRWQELEELNTGRLRVASKGIKRVGDDLIQVDEAEQLATGMYMAGQVAVLRNGATSVAALHDEVTNGAQTLLDAHASLTPKNTPSNGPLDVAIIGMACAYPGAPDLDTYWANILRGLDAVTEVPAHRWDSSIYYREGGKAAEGNTISKWGGFLPPIPFDATAYGIPPASLASIDPAQLLALEMSARALADAGYDKRSFDRERAGVIFGAEAGGDLANAGILRALLPAYIGDIPAEIEDQLPVFTEDSFPGTLANVISGRVANRLNLGGINYTVDAACGTSLGALDAACKELMQGTSDIMLCGAVDLHNGINDYIMFTSAGALSPTGRCRPFDGAADGIALGEGAACIVLKRLDDALRDGDQIYAVVKGVGAASDGKALGLTAPRPEGQYRALERAYDAAGISPIDVGLIEAHGTGTVVGDGTELKTLTKFFREQGAEDGETALGSVKGQVGHTKCAAGLAGLIKATLALNYGVVPPTRNLKAPNGEWSEDSSPFSFSTVARPWTTARQRRIAGVSAFGFGGINFHAVLESAPTAATTRHAVRDWDSELFLFRGRDAETAKGRLRELLALASDDSIALRELAATNSAWADRSNDAVQFAFVCADREELSRTLTAALNGETADGKTWFAASTQDSGKLAYLYPGQGSQRTGMLGGLFTAFPALHDILDLDEATAKAIYPAHAFSSEVVEANNAALRDTRMAQPALGMVESALTEVLDQLAVVPDMLAGHSYGELVALATAGAFDTRTLLAMSRKRAEAINAAGGDDPGTMAAVVGSKTDVTSALAAIGANDVVVANHNSPTQAVISGPTASVDRAVEALRERGLTAKRIPVACAFHSHVVAAASDEFGGYLATQPIAKPKIPVWSNRRAATYSDEFTVAEELAAQIAAPVRFVEQIEDMYAHGARTFVEVGPGSVLSGLVKAILGERPYTSITIDQQTGSAIHDLLLAVAKLAVAGANVRTEWLFRGRASAVNADAPRPKKAGWVVDGQMVRRADGSFLPGGLLPARQVPRTTMSQNSNQAAPGIAAVAPLSEREQVTIEFLRAQRDLIAAQRDVLLGYFGAAPVAPSYGAPQYVTQPAYASQPAYVSQPVTYVTPPAPAAGTHSPAVAPAAAPTVAAVVQSAPAPAPVASVPAVSVPAPAAGVPAPAVDVLGAVIGIISDRTGYPADMIEPDLDLEADLSIDSIKRTEIAGTLITTLGLSVDGGADDKAQDELSRMRTANTITTWINEHMPVAAVGAPIAVVTTVTTVTASAPSTSVPTATVLAPAVDVLGTVIGIISDRTGYPADMIEPDLDLEADLSIDSIKRTEIAGTLITTLGLSVDGGADDKAQDELSRMRTANTITTWINEHTGATSAPTASVAASVPAAALVAAVTTAPANSAPPASLPVNVLGTVIDVIADRTGYPADMIEPDLDLEADLSIDSIKRTEIAGTLITTLGLSVDGGADDKAQDELSRMRTANTITTWINEHTGTAAIPEPSAVPVVTTVPSDAASAPITAPAAPVASAQPLTLGEAPVRFLTRVAPADAVLPTSLAGQRALVIAEPSQQELADAVLTELSRRGAATLLAVGGAVQPGTDLTGATLVSLTAMGAADEPVAPMVFSSIRDAIKAGVSRILVAAPYAGFVAPEQAAGLRGLMRSVAKEHETIPTKLVETSAHAGPFDIAGVLADELGTDGGPVIVQRDGGYRVSLDLQAEPLGSLATAGGGPAGAGEVEARAMGLGRESVVLLIGGARGITARFATTLALASGCRIELAGRTALHGVIEDDTTRDAHTQQELRAALARAGKALPEIEPAVKAILAQREVAQTLHQIEEAGGVANYRSLDVRDTAAVQQVVKDLNAQYGRIDGVVYAAGVIEDKLMLEKDDETFRRVFATKVDGARVLLDTLSQLSTPPSFVVFFGSIAALLGNRGQTDYAAANDAIESLGASWAARTGNRALTVHWGPWAPSDEHGGMVSVELAREYERRAIGLIDPEQSTASLMYELAYGSPQVRSVLYAAESLW